MAVPTSAPEAPSPQNPDRPRPHRRPGARLLTAAVITLACTAAVSGYLFQPWKLWTDEVVNEPLPVVAGDTPAGGSRDRGSGAPGQPDPIEALAEGTLVSHEHATSGTARLLRLPDGALVLRIEDLTTTNGPQLRVWLTDAPLIGGRQGWFLFDDGRHLDLGPLKGNIGDQNYAIPATVDLRGLHSLSIWCARFHVSFGAAELGSLVSSDA